MLENWLSVEEIPQYQLIYTPAVTSSSTHKTMYFMIASKVVTYSFICTFFLHHGIKASDTLIYTFLHWGHEQGIYHIPVVKSKVGLLQSKIVCNN